MEGERDKGEWLVTGAWLTLTSLVETISHQGGEQGLRVLRERGY